MQAEGVEESTSLVTQYLSCPDSDIRDIYGMAVDLILAGIDTVSGTSLQDYVLEFSASFDAPPPLLNPKSLCFHNSNVPSHPLPNIGKSLSHVLGGMLESHWKTNVEILLEYSKLNLY